MALTRFVQCQKIVQAITHSEQTADAVPFSFKNKGAFGFKVISYFGFGLALPLVASGYQLSVFISHLTITLPDVVSIQLEEIDALGP